MFWMRNVSVVLSFLQVDVISRAGMTARWEAAEQPGAAAQGTQFSLCGWVLHLTQLPLRCPKGTGG